jgi:hypothetical protein
MDTDTEVAFCLIILLIYSQISYVASSAGTRPSGEVNQLAIQVMKEYLGWSCGSYGWI